MNRLLSFDGKGIYCEQAGVHIDPWRKVPKALITHAHSDHARRGMGSYISTKATVPILQQRLGKKIDVYGVEYGEKIHINGVEFSFHPAGHVVGSAQIRVEYKGEVWVVSGDYKLTDDGISGKFYPVPCDTFITESTFGLPIYNWESQDTIFNKINNWWRKNKEQGKVSVLTAYSLGKAQRIIQNIDHSIGTVYTHSSIDKTNIAIESAGIQMKPWQLATDDLLFKDFQGNLVIAPGSSANSIMAKQWKDFELGVATGWMNSRTARKRRSSDIGFCLSDHADWSELNQAVEASRADEIYVTHGFSDSFSRWLSEKGYDAKIVKTAFEGEKQEPAEVKAV